MHLIEKANHGVHGRHCGTQRALCNSVALCPRGATYFLKENVLKNGGRFLYKISTSAFYLDDVSGSVLSPHLQ